MGTVLNDLEKSENGPKFAIFMILDGWIQFCSLGNGPKLYIR